MYLYIHQHAWFSWVIIYCGYWGLHQTNSILAIIYRSFYSTLGWLKDFSALLTGDTRNVNSLKRIENIGRKNQNATNEDLVRRRNEKVATLLNWIGWMDRLGVSLTALTDFSRVDLHSKWPSFKWYQSVSSSKIKPSLQMGHSPMVYTRGKIQSSITVTPGQLKCDTVTCPQTTLATNDLPNSKSLPAQVIMHQEVGGRLLSA